jgi:hypothetical protein
MWRFTKLVNKKNKQFYTDRFMYGMYKDEKVKLAMKDTCLESFRVLLSRNPRKREFVALRTYESALANQYIKLVLGGRSSNIEYLEVDPNKGEKFIEMWFIGFMRELIAKEWKFIVIIPPIVTYILGRIT